MTTSERVPRGRVSDTVRRLVDRYRDNSLVRNSIFILATSIVTSLLGFVYWIVAARSYSPHEVGLAAALISAMTLASTLTSLGLASTLVQMLPRRSVGHAWSLTVNTALVTGLLAALVLGVALVVVLPLLSSQFAVVRNNPAYSLFFLAGVVLTTGGILLDYTFVAERAAGKMLARNLLFSALRVPLLLVALALVAQNAIGIVGAWVIATGVSCAGAMLLVLRLGRSYRSVVRGFGRQVRSMLSPLAGHHFINLGGALPIYVLPLLVAALLSPTDNAYFYTTWMVCNALFMVPFAVSSALFAEGSHAAHKIRDQVRVSVIAAAVLLAPLLLVLLLGGRYVMAAFGAMYPEHVLPLLMLLAVSAIPEAVTSIYISVLRVEERLGFAAALNMEIGVLTVGLAWLLIPSLHLVGAGWAALLGQLAGAAVVVADLLARRRRRRSPAHLRRRPREIAMSDASVPHPGRPFRPLRVLMLAEPYAPAIGGLERHVEVLSRELVRRGHHVSVATTTHPGSPSFEVAEGVHVYRIGGLSRVLIPFYETDRRFHPTVPDPGVVAALARLVRRERPQIVHAHSWMLYSFLPLKAWSGARLVVTLHDYSLVCPKKTYLHRGGLCEGPAYAKCVRCAGSHYGAFKGVALTTGLRVSSKLHRRVDRFVAASDAVREPVTKAAGLTTPVEVVPTFVPDDAAERGARAQRPSFLPPSDDYLLFVGALGPHKGIDVLLEAWCSLAVRPPLVLIGTGREDTPDHFPGGVRVAYDVPHEVVMAAWNHCLVAVVPSRSEGGGPTVAIEAMASGRPVIASAVGGTPEVVLDEETGLLVPPGDSEALREALESLLRDPARRSRMGEAGRQRARLFTISTAADRLEQVYADTLADHIADPEVATPKSLATAADPLGGWP